MSLESNKMPFFTHLLVNNKGYFANLLKTEPGKPFVLIILIVDNVHITLYLCGITISKSSNRYKDMCFECQWDKSPSHNYKK